MKKLTVCAILTILVVFIANTAFANPLPTPTPEPGTFVLFGVGLLGLVAAVRKHVKK